MTKRKIDITAISMIILIMLFAYLAVIKGNKAKADILAEENSVLLSKFRSAAEIELQIGRVVGEIDSIQKNLEAFSSQLPEEKRIYDFLKDIDNLAKKNNIHLKSIRPGVLENKAIYSKVSVTISGTSEFKDFYRFLFQLENIPRITKVEHLHINKPQGGEGCDIEMDLAVFVGGKYAYE